MTICTRTDLLAVYLILLLLLALTYLISNHVTEFYSLKRWPRKARDAIQQPSGQYDKICCLHTKIYKFIQNYHQQATITNKSKAIAFFNGGYITVAVFEIKLFAFILIVVFKSHAPHCRNF